MNDKLGLAQAIIFINGVLKVHNQAIGMILHITILKVLPKDLKGGGGVGCRVHSREGGVFQLQGVADFSPQRGMKRLRIMIASLTK